MFAKSVMEYIIIAKDQITLDVEVDPYLFFDNLCEILESNLKGLETKRYRKSMCNSYQLKIRKTCFEFDIMAKKTTNKQVCHITIESFGRKDCSIHILEKINEIISNKKYSLSKSFYIIISYDSISDYYCQQIYPQLCDFDRKLRQLMLNIYTVAYGKDYFIIPANDQLINKVKQNIGDRKEDGRIAKYLYGLDYSDIDFLLFTPKWLKEDTENINHVLEDTKDFTNLSDSQIRDIIKDLHPKTDWERLFSHKLPIDDIQGIFNKLRKYRNNIAHCKFFYHEQYVECNKILSYLINSIDSAIIGIHKDGISYFSGTVQLDVKKIANALFEAVQSEYSNCEDYSSDNYEVDKDYLYNSNSGYKITNHKKDEKFVAVKQNERRRIQRVNFRPKYKLSSSRKR
jgi:hypothetical protein